MTRGDLLWIRRLWKPYAWVLVLIVAGTLVSTVVRVSLPLVLKRAFDGLESHLAAGALLAAAGLYLGLGTLEWLLATGLIFARGTMNIAFEAAARRQAYARLVRQAPGFFQRFRTGDLVTRLTDDVSEKLSWFICSGIFRALAAGAVIVFAVAMMIRLDPLLTLFTVGPLPVLIVLFIRTGTVLDRRFESVQERISNLNGALEACFSGVRVVKAYGREEAEERSFRRFASECRQAEIEAAKSQTLIDSLFGHVWQLGVVAVLLAGGIGVMKGRLTLGTFVAFDAYVLMLIFPMFDIGTFFVRGRQSAVSIGRLRELEEEPPGIAERADARPPAEPVRGSLRFESVGYAYPAPAGAAQAAPESRSEGAPPGPCDTGPRFALSGVSFELHPGEIVAVVGTVGAGKSTLLRLVPRLSDPSEGRILLDGADLRGLRLGPLRRAIGYVPQEALLFTGTIGENIVFGRDGVSAQDLRRIVEVARLGSDLAGFTHGLDTRVGARGLTLSGGQKQRVALARALAGQPRVLVLDDITAALDAETEAALWEELHRVLPDLATLVVTHRTATLERADRVLVLQEGRLVEQGTHAELSERGAVYRSIYRRHRLEERVGAGGGLDPVPDAERDPAPDDES